MMHRIILPTWSVPLTLFAESDTHPERFVTDRHTDGDCTVFLTTDDAADLWEMVRSQLGYAAIPFDWYTPETLIQHRPTAKHSMRCFPLDAEGAPLISAYLLTADLATRADEAPFPPLLTDPCARTALVTPQGVAHVSVDDPDGAVPEEDSYPSISLFLNGTPVAVLEHHPTYNAWVVRVYAATEEEPVAYVRLDTGESIPT